MADPAFANNPWAAEHWNLTQQGAYIKKYGLEVAKTKAKQAGTTVGASKPVQPQRFAPLPRSSNYTVIVQRKGSNVVAGGGGIVGAGSSGDGPPGG